MSEETIQASGAALGATVSGEGSAGVVVFAHGSGSSRFSPRNRLVAAALGSAGLATVLMDLLTEEEAADRRNVFDIALLASRLRAGIAWARAAGFPDASIGLFGASTGAAAALVAAAEERGVGAVVSRGGRPDLAGDALPRVEAPTLLVVGGDDRDVLSLNRSAAAALRCPHEVLVVPGATHLFEEPGTLERVASAARAWFGRHLAAPRPG